MAGIATSSPTRKSALHLARLGAHPTGRDWRDVRLRRVGRCAAHVTSANCAAFSRSPPTRRQISQARAMLWKTTRTSASRRRALKAEEFGRASPPPPARRAGVPRGEQLDGSPRGAGARGQRRLCACSRQRHVKKFTPNRRWPTPSRARRRGLPRHRRRRARPRRRRGDQGGRARPHGEGLGGGAETRRWLHGRDARAQRVLRRPFGQGHDRQAGARRRDRRGREAFGRPPLRADARLARRREGTIFSVGSGTKGSRVSVSRAKSTSTIGQKNVCAPATRRLRARRLSACPSSRTWRGAATRRSTRTSSPS